MKIKNIFFQEDDSKVNETILKRAHAELNIYIHLRRVLETKG